VTMTTLRTTGGAVTVTPLASSNPMDGSSDEIDLVDDTCARPATDTGEDALVQPVEAVGAGSRL
jgi:hypothetical protein